MNLHQNFKIYLNFPRGINGFSSDSPSYQCSQSKVPFATQHNRGCWQIQLNGNFTQWQNKIDETVIKTC